MKIALLTIGNEVLFGKISNTNATYISHALEEEGLSISLSLTVPDEKTSLESGILELIEKVDCIIATGGLGPTIDDLTRDVVEKLFVKEKIENIPNTVGTAEGLFVVSKNNKTLFFLPGVPLEMKEMFHAFVLAKLQKRFPIREKKKVEKFFFCLLKEVEINPLLEALKKEYPEADFGIYPSHGMVEVIVKSQFEKTLHACKKKLEEAFGSYLFFSKDGSIGNAVHELLRAEKKTLALAESCTGGGIASCLTKYPGASDYFLGSFVVYANEMKEKLLAVSSKTLFEKGAVSKETVEEMCRGLFAKTSADYVIAVSGIAGPSGGSLEKPVGTVFIGIGKEGKIETKKFHFLGNREVVIAYTIATALGLLWRKMVFGVSFGE